MFSLKTVLGKNKYATSAFDYGGDNEGERLLS